MSILYRSNFLMVNKQLDVETCVLIDYGLIAPKEPHLFLIVKERPDCFTQKKFYDELTVCTSDISDLQMK